MQVSRLVSVVSKQFLSSFFPRVTSFPRHVAPILCRTITTGKDHLKLGNVGGRMKKDTNPELDVIIGRWLQQSVKTSKPGGRGEKEWTVPISLEHELYKPYVTYMRHHNKWLVEMGFVDKGIDVFYKFKIGKDFIFIYPDLTMSRIVVYQDGDDMKWTFQPLNPDPSVAPRPEEAVHATTKVFDNKLIVKTEYPDETTVVKTYIRDLTG